MEIQKIVSNKEIVLLLSGRLDTVTSPSLEVELNQVFGETETLILDFGNLEYISSSGLRLVLLSYKSMMAKNGSLIVKNANEEIKEIFEMTGFSDFLEIQ